MLLILQLFAQGINQTYMTNIKIAHDYYNAGKFDSASKAYQSAFKFKGQESPVFYMLLLLNEKPHDDF